MSHWLATLDDPFLHSSRRSPLSHLARLDDRLLDMGGLLSSLERDVSGLLRHYGRPSNSLDVSPSTSILSNVEVNENGERKFVVNLPLGNNVRPEDVKVGIKDNIVTIEAKREQKSEDGNSRLYQEYVRKFNLPSGVKAQEVKSELTPEGSLRLEAPLPKEEKIEEKKEEVKATEEKKPQPIPIQVE